MQPSETGCKALAVKQPAGSSMTGQGQNASNPAESPLTQLPCPASIPQISTKTLPFQLWPDTGSTGVSPGSCAGGRTCTAGLKHSFHLSEVDGEGIIMYLCY